MFARRLYEDRQKNEMMKTLNAGATYAFIEPFLNDLILLLDRMEKTNDEFSISVYDELYDILNRRGVSRIKVTTAFDPAINKAVRVYESTEVETLTNKQIVRNGYTLSGKVIRPAEVIVEKPVAKDKESSE